MTISDGLTGRFEPHNEKTARLVAQKYCRLLRDQLTAKQMVEVEGGYKGIENEFCDGNMVMDEAVEEVTGQSFKLDRADTEQENEAELMNRAWEIAFDENFAVTA